MNTYDVKTQENKSHSVSHDDSQNLHGRAATFQLEDKRQEVAVHKKMHQRANNSLQMKQIIGFVDNRPESQSQQQLQHMVSSLSPTSSLNLTSQPIQRHKMAKNSPAMNAIQLSGHGNTDVVQMNGMTKEQKEKVRYAWSEEGMRKRKIKGEQNQESKNLRERTKRDALDNNPNHQRDLERQKQHAEMEKQRKREQMAAAAERREASQNEEIEAARKQRHQQRFGVTPETAEYRRQDAAKWSGSMSDGEKQSQLDTIRNRPYTDVPLPGHQGAPEPEPSNGQQVADVADQVNTLTVTGAAGKLYDFVASKIRTQKGLLKRMPRSRAQKNMRRTGQIGAVTSDVVGLVPGGGTVGSIGSGGSAAIKAKGEGASNIDATLRGVVAGTSSFAQNLVPVGGTAMSMINLVNDTLDLAAGDEVADPNIYKKLAEHKYQLAMLHSKYLEQGKPVPKKLLHVKERINRHLEMARSRLPSQEEPSRGPNRGPRAVSPLVLPPVENLRRRPRVNQGGNRGGRSQKPSRIMTLSDLQEQNQPQIGQNQPSTSSSQNPNPPRRTGVMTLADLRNQDRTQTGSGQPSQDGSSVPRAPRRTGIMTLADLNREEQDQGGGQEGYNSSSGGGVSVVSGSGNNRQRGNGNGTQTVVTQRPPAQTQTHQILRLRPRVNTETTSARAVQDPRQETPQLDPNLMDRPGRELGAIGAEFEQQINNAERDGRFNLMGANAIRRAMRDAVRRIIDEAMGQIEDNPHDADQIMESAYAAMDKVRRGLRNKLN